VYSQILCQLSRVYFATVLAASMTTLSAAVEPQTDGVLTLDEALIRVLRDNPRLAAYGLDIRAADARRVQAGLRPNPELNLEIEEVRFGDSPSLNGATRAPDGTLLGRSVTDVDNAGFGESQYTLGVSQLIELGGKRGRRIELADRDKEVVLWSYEVLRADVLLEARRAYLDILAGQELVRLRESLLDLARTAATTVDALTEAGKLSPLLGNRAQVEVSQARIQLENARRSLAGARYRLAMLWGQQEPDFTRASGDLYVRPLVPSIGELERRVQSSPDLMRWTSEVARRESAADLERSQRVPDLTVFLGWRGTGLPDGSTSTFDSSGALISTDRESFDSGLDNSLVAGLSIPLPLFNRNQGNIQEAEAMVSKATHERRDTFFTISTVLTALQNDAEALQAEADELERLILPTAEATFEATRTGFEQGKFPYLDVLDTQRTLFEARNQHVEALAGLHQAVAEMERFLGGSMEVGDDSANEKENEDASR